MNPVTPDGRYFVVKQTLWRCSDPALHEDERQHLVNELMDARRAVKAAKAAKAAKASGQPGEMKKARAAVDMAKIGLGERGPVWWEWHRSLGVADS